MNTNIKKILNRKQTGFTLIEILVVIGMIALLAAVVIVAINPARQFAQGRNTQRVSNVNAILNAIGQNMADNKGIFTCGAEVIDTNERTICIGTVECTALAATAKIDLACLTPTYISALPFDPNANATNGYKWTSETEYNTGYKVSKNSTGRITVTAPEALNEDPLKTGTPPTAPAVSVTR